MDDFRDFGVCLERWGGGGIRMAAGEGGSGGCTVPIKEAMHKADLTPVYLTGMVDGWSGKVERSKIGKSKLKEWFNVQNEFL